MSASGFGGEVIRAALYARMSGEGRSKEGRNLGGQIEMGRECCKQQGYQIVAELKEDDRGTSGAAFELPQLSKAIQMACEGEFDVLVVREQDRLARSLVRQLFVEDEFRREDLPVLPLPCEGPLWL